MQQKPTHFLGNEFMREIVKLAQYEACGNYIRNMDRGSVQLYHML
jgi:hypothetical protein